MLTRCYDARHRAHRYYSSRGIVVCDRWRNNFRAFLKDVGRRPSREHSLDRIDNSGNYEPGNVRWATWKQQQRNRSSNRLVTYRGRTMPLIEATELVGLPYRTVWSRLSHGWTLRDALETPVHSNEGSLLSLVRAAGQNYGRVATRVKSLGWSVERALTQRSQAGAHSLRSRAMAAGLAYKAVHLRITRYGWTEKRALSTPIRETSRGK